MPRVSAYYRLDVDRLAVVEYVRLDRPELDRSPSGDDLAR
jgi:hypothetical protein